MKRRSLIVAYAQDSGIIGDGKNLPAWNLAKDRGFFARTTKAAGVVIMGRKNYESLPDGYRPLPDRINIVLTQSPTWRPDGPENDSVIVVHSLWEALEEAEKASGEKIAFIGGGEIYRLALRNVVLEELYLTGVDGEFEGSVTFPADMINADDYQLIKEEEFTKDEKNSHSFRIRSYVRKGS